MNCHQCMHQRYVAGDCHIQCVHPRAGGGDEMLSLINAATPDGAMKTMGVTLNAHGVRNGWAFWPFNFDPVWVSTCDGYETKKVEELA